MINSAFNRWNLLLPKHLNEPPKAIVILIGWWGAKPRHLNKYVEIYHQDEKKNCITLSGIVDSRTIATKNDKVLRNFAFQGLVEISNLLEKYKDNKENKELPVMVHVFSNGGGFVWEHMIRLLKEDQQQQQNVDELTETKQGIFNSHPNIPLIRKNMKGQIFDSAPAFISVDSFAKALEASGTIRNTFLLMMVRVATFCFLKAESLYFSISGKEAKHSSYWNYLLKTNESFSNKQGFIYSSMDHVTDMVQLEKFIEHRKMQEEAEVSVLKFDDSKHVLHYMNHPKKYKEFVWKFVNELSEKSQ